METVIVTAPPAGQFAVAATASLHERNTRGLKHNDAFAVFDPRGDIVSGDGSPDGLYYCDTRHLSHLDVWIEGMRPILLSSALREDNALLTCDLTNPNILGADGSIALPHDAMHFRRSIFLWDAASFERLLVRNCYGGRARLSIEFRFEADFADVFEVRGTPRERRGRHEPALVTPNGVVLSYVGLDRKRRSTRLRFDPEPDRLDASRAAFDIDLDHGQSRIIFIEIDLVERTRSRPPRADYLFSIVAARRRLAGSSSRAASVGSSNEIFNEAARRSLSDIYTLVTDTPYGPYPYAGIPWFSTAFGRDAILTSYQIAWMDPSIAKGVLAFLAAYQATEEDPSRDAEPGKILHEMRHGEMAELGEVPFGRYYGSIDATPLFVVLAGAYFERSGDLATVEKLWPNIEAALAWIDRYGDRDGDGFVEYARSNEHGLINQGWKDSHDSVFHADGALAHGPIALCEVQAYVYAAKRAAAVLAEKLGKPERGADLMRSADALRLRFEDAFWCADLGTYALALDGEKRPCRVCSSNAGHVLFAGLASPDRAKRLAATLMAGASFSGWGIRTIAATEVRYNPMSYHNGSVWPHDNALIALGFSRYGLKAEAAALFQGLFRASVFIDLRRLPELFCGFPRRPGQGPTFYPVACSPQAWAAAAPFALVRAILGLDFDPQRRIITLERPVLPEFMRKLTLRNVSVGGAKLDIVVERAGAEVAVHGRKRSGDVRLSIVN